MASKTPAIKAVLFDLGKVILFFNFEPAFRKLARDARKSPRDVEDYFVQSGLEVLYDGGKITSRRFYAEVRKALGLRMGYAAFEKVWNGIFTPNRPMIRLVRRLGRRYRLVLVSNTNEMHYRHLVRRHAVLRAFSRRVLSFREKVRKPDERIYRIAARACQASPAEIFYIDDRADLTEAAAALGFRTHTYKNGMRALLEDLRAVGIL